MNFVKTRILRILILVLLTVSSCSQATNTDITPNQFKGSDIERIQAAINAAEGTTNKVVIPPKNSNGTNVWLIDSAILLPGNMTVILDNSTIQLSDQCRDNLFRTANVGEGITEVNWYHDISIIGVGNATLKGADNPRATGDGGKTLALDSQFEHPIGNGKASYGTDAGKEGIKQTGDWRNHGIIIAYVDGFKLKNLTIENMHCWAVTHERVINAEISDIRLLNPPRITINGETLYVANRDGINLRQGCKNFRINNISGETGDDFIAMTLLGLHSSVKEAGRITGSMVTTREHKSPEDDIENIYITNITCKTKNHGVALRAIDYASISHVYIDGLISRGNDEFKTHQTAMLFGGRGYGPANLPGYMNNIYAMNIMGNTRSALIHVEEAIADCYFMNGIYSGEGEYIVSYNYIDKDTFETKYRISKNNIGKKDVTNVQEINMIKVP